MEDAPRAFRNFRKFEYVAPGKREDSSPVPSDDPVSLPPPNQKGQARFATYAWVTLVINLLIVAWGVFVRAGKYGDGCGSHWPLCDGSSAPLMGPIARIIESSHRVTGTLGGILAIGVLVGAFRLFPKRHLVRRGAVAFMVMTLVEGLVGALLVKYQLVVENDSAARAGFMAAHGVSTFLLMGAILSVAIAARDQRVRSIRGQGTVGWILLMGAVGMIFMGVSGAISALGHQLHETPDVIKAAMNPATHWMVRLQPLHPLIATSIGLYLLLTAGLINHLRPDPAVRTAVRWMFAVYALQMGIGVLNIWLKAPIAMQMLHLVIADLNWMSLLAVGLYAFAEGVERVEHRPAPVEAPVPQEPLRGRALVKAYVALTKPRVISLLLFTTLTAAIAARGEWPGLWLMTVLFFGGYMSAGAANAINMVIDRDIDITMKRTATRPTVTQSISSPNALRFAFALAGISFALLWSQANLLSAVMALSGLVFYVVIYTMLLKRRTWQNIVIGGAAGAFPPLVGWAAVTNDLPPLALYLFAIIFVWTPVHFWALALMLKEEYAAAGVPMLPVVKGDRNTVAQIAGYGVLTFVVSLLPMLLPKVGWIYAGGATVLSAILLGMCVELYRDVTRPKAVRLFHFSMIYLALLFLVLAIDRTVVMG